ncbi:hypothetical protein [Flavobacterium sp.]|uniref:hypothetical protein n=1 Tax=Flavobacterium sp. TaxID=239 RepID=UPI0031E31510
MAIQTLNTIKNWFKTTLKPSQQQFWDTWDSFRHKLDKVPVKEVEGIDELLNAKADKSVLNAHITDVNAHASLLELKEDKSQKGIAHGYAPLNGFTKLASQYLDIVNDLVSGGSSSLLSAEQGVLLQNQIKNINATLASDNLNLNTFQEIVDAVESIQTSLSTILVNDLTTGGSMKALTAEMGKILNENKENKSQRGIANGYAPLDNFAKISNTYLNIVNDLITGGTDSLLSAEQGKILKEKIDGIDSLIDNKIDTAEFEYHLSDPNAHSDLLHEKEDKANKNKADGYVGLDGISKISTGFLSMVNDLTTGGDNPLTAEQGKILKGLIDDHTGGDFQATLIAGSEATIDKKFSVRSQNDEIGATSFLTVNSESSQVDGIAGISMFTNKRLDMAGEHVVLQSFMGYGSLSMRDNGVVLNGSSTSLTLNGGTGGLTLQGGSVATKIATGGLGVTVDGKNIIRSINGLEADTSGNIDISTGGTDIPTFQQILNVDSDESKIVHADIMQINAGETTATQFQISKSGQYGVYMRTDRDFLVNSPNRGSIGIGSNGVYLDGLTNSAIRMTTNGTNGIYMSGGSMGAIEINNSDGVSLQGRSKGISLDGQGGALKLMSSSGITANSKNVVTSINGVEADQYGEVTTTPQNLQQIIENDPSTNVNTEFYIQSTGVDSATSSITFSPGGTMPTTQGLGLYTDNLLGLTGSGFALGSALGQGKISSVGNNELVINSESGKLFLKGGGSGISIDGQGGEVNIDSPYAVKINSKNAITSIDGVEADEFGEVTTTPQNLQQTLNAGGYAEFNGGWDALNMFNGGAKAFDVVMSDPVAVKSSNLVMRPDQIDIINHQGSTFSELKFSNGNVQIVRNNASGVTNVGFSEPTVISNVNFPAPTVAGTYTLATTKDLPAMTTANTAPTSFTDTGVKGDIRIDANYIYICIATNTWKRCPLTTW